MSRKSIVSPQYRCEASLVHAARHGDQRAVEHLVLWHPPMRALIGSLKRRLDPNGRFADDLEGIARLAVLEALRSFKPDRGARFTTYAYYFVKGDILKALYPANERVGDKEMSARIRFVPLENVDDPESDHVWNREQQLLNSDPTYGIDPGYARVENADGAASLRRFVAGLPPNQRSVTTAIFWGGQTHGAVAAAHGTSRPAVTRTLQRVLARAAKELEPELQLAA
jgi:RNA polymerase sigma factor (sigma-70 family)